MEDLRRYAGLDKLNFVAILDHGRYWAICGQDQSHLAKVWWNWDFYVVELRLIDVRVNEGRGGKLQLQSEVGLGSKCSRIGRMGLLWKYRAGL